MQTDKKQNNKILEAINLDKHYLIKNKKIEVLKGVNLELKRGEKLVISGRSGTGKSTLLGLLAGLEPPDSGEIIFDGRRVNGLSNEELALIRQKRVGIVFQNFNLMPSWTACENVEAALFFMGIAKSERRERSEQILDSVGLGDRLDNLPAELSVGQQQRVAVARALVNGPDIVFADEPTGDVDRETADEIIDIMLKWMETRRATLLVVTHGEFPTDIGDRLLFLKDGVLLEPPRGTSV